MGERQKAKDKYEATQFGANTECPDLDTPKESGATNEILATKSGVGISKEKVVPNLDEPIFEGTINGHQRNNS